MLKTLLPAKLSGELLVMPSKSASHRAVILAALSKAHTELSPLQMSRDIEATLRCANALGLVGSHSFTPTDDFGTLTLSGGLTPKDSPLRILDCGESGSTLRFFVPLALDGHGPVRFVGHGRLMQRPMTVYEELFRPMGIEWRQEGDTLTVCGKLTPGVYSLPGNVSSQFITGLLLALPLTGGESVLRLTTPPESIGYIELTRRIAADFGLISHWNDDRTELTVLPGIPSAPDAQIAVERDWSHAAFWLVAGALGAEEIFLPGMRSDSCQGDKAIVSVLKSMGAKIDFCDGGVRVSPSALHGASVSVRQIPDLMPILSVAMAGARGESRITDGARLRIKESDRLSAMALALSAVGASVTELPDGLIIRGGAPLHGASVDGCNDHRIVMSMAIAAALTDTPLTVSDAEAVTKSAPAFWQEYAQLGGKSL